MTGRKRQRQQPNRFGESSKNMDHMFKDIDEATSNDNKDPDFVQSDEQPSDDDGSPNSSSPEKIPFKENGSQSSVQKQMARVEAKLNEMHSILMQIHRACISNVVSTQMDSENVQELPLTSDASLNKFEQDLTQKPYRQKIVSKRNLNICFKLLHAIKSAFNVFH